MRTIILAIAASVALPSAAPATTIVHRDITVSSGPQSAFDDMDNFVDRAAFWARYADTRGTAPATVAPAGSLAPPAEIAWDHMRPTGIDGKLPGLVIDIPATPMPEPQVWAMMVIGLALAGGLLRRSARTVSFA